MGKKKHRKTKTSKGLRASISSGTTLAVSRSMSNLDKIHHKIDAWLKGKNPWITIENTGGPADRPFIRVRANSLWGNSKSRYNIYMKKEKNAPSLLQRKLP